MTREIPDRLGPAACKEPKDNKGSQDLKEMLARRVPKGTRVLRGRRVLRG